jgi:hypothetical protein
MFLFSVTVSLIVIATNRRQLREAIRNIESDTDNEFSVNDAANLTLPTVRPA